MTKRGSLSPRHLDHVVAGPAVHTDGKWGWMHLIFGTGNARSGWGDKLPRFVINTTDYLVFDDSILRFR